MKITVVGAGNVGTQLAVHASEKGHDVIIYTSKPDKIQNMLSIVDENDVVIHSGIIKGATNDPTIAFSSVDLIFIVVPAFHMHNIAQIIEPFSCSGVKICLVPGTGGGECAFSKCQQKGAIVFGIQRVPSVARLVEPGKTVRAIGYRDEMFVASMPNSFTNECSTIIEELLDIKCTSLPNYLNLTLTPSNPILHTTRLYVLYNDFRDGMKYSSVPLFYEGWTDETSELLFACDDEVQKICNSLKDFDLTFVKSLKKHYESYTKRALTNKIRSIKGFKGLTSPTIKVDCGYIPDFNSRYFTADFSYGLSILIQIAMLLEIDTPNMNLVMDWYLKVAYNQDFFSFKKYGITNREDFIRFYST